MNAKPIKLKYHTNGLLTIDQTLIGFIRITFNPDDERFYLHDTRQENETIGKFKLFRNAVAYARKLTT